MCDFEQLLFGSGLDQFWSYQESFLVVILNPIDLSLSWIRECGVPFFPFHFSILPTKSVWVKILLFIHFSPNFNFFYSVLLSYFIQNSQKYKTKITTLFYLLSFGIRARFRWDWFLFFNFKIFFICILSLKFLHLSFFLKY